MLALAQTFQRACSMYETLASSSDVEMAPEVMIHTYAYNQWCVKMLFVLVKLGSFQLRGVDNRNATQVPAIWQVPSVSPADYTGKKRNAKL